MPRSFWIVFAVWQALGVVGAVCWSFTMSRLGPVLWGMGFLLMMPGNYLAAEAVDRTLWTSGLSLRALSVITLALGVAINAAVWYIVGSGVRSIARRLRGTRPHSRVRP